MFNMENSMIKSKVLFGLVFVGILCVWLTIAIVYSLFRLSIGYQAVKEGFVASEFYKLYIDDTYENEMEKEIEEGLAKIDQKEEGTIDDIEVKESNDSDVIKLRIKRRRKLTSRTQQKTTNRLREEPEYERINPEPVFEKDKSKSSKKKHNIFDREEEKSVEEEDAGFEKMDNKMMKELIAEPIQVLLAKK